MDQLPFLAFLPKAVPASTRPLSGLNSSDTVLSMAAEWFIGRPEIEGRELISGRTQ
jgi:hypothetical protein